MPVKVVFTFVFFFQAYSALGSADRPWRHTGSITSGVPTTGYEVLANPHIQKIADKVRDNQLCR
jgi:hypothetical protein